MRGEYPIGLSMLLVLLLLCGDVFAQNRDAGGTVLATVPDFSGLQWIDGNRFLAVHDAKNPKEVDGFARVSFVWLPEGLEGIRRRTLEVSWPGPQGPSSDLESITRIPGTDRFVLLESGGSSAKKRQFKRAFVVEIKQERLEMRGFVELPEAENIEGSAVASTQNGLVLLWAERSHGKNGSIISWATFDPDGFKLGATNTLFYSPAAFTGDGWRPVSALEIDSKGIVYAASAYDPDDDGGPFASAIWKIGRIDRSAPIAKALSLDPKPELIAKADGVKIEALTIVETGGKYELFYGFDDEHFGGGLRKVVLKNSGGR